MVLTADTPRIPRTITAFPICPSLPGAAHCLFMYPPPPPLMCRKCPMVIWIVTLSFLLSLWWLPAPCILPWCPSPDAFCALSIYPSMFSFPICQHLFKVTDLTTRGYPFWRFQPPDTLYMLSRLYRKVNPFRSDLLLLLGHDSGGGTLVCVANAQ
jgi:hypothetical protein